MSERIADSRADGVIRPLGVPAVSDSRLPDGLGAAAEGLLGTAELSWLFVDGWRADASRTTALLFAKGQSHPRAVVKIGRGAGRAEVQVEAANLVLFSGALDKDFRQTVPRLLEHHETPDYVALFESVIPGLPLRALRKPLAIETLAERVTEWLLAFHRTVGIRAEPLRGTSFEETWLHPFTAYRGCFRLTPQESRFLERIESIAGSFEGVPLPLVSRHGDLCPGNVLIDGHRLGVIDWDTPLQPSLPAYDLIHLFACLAWEVGGKRAQRFEALCRQGNPLSDSLRRSLIRYADALGIPEAVPSVIFTTFWLEYAVEKAAAGAVREWDQGFASAAGPWGLVRLGDGSCLEVQWLARNDTGLEMP